MLSLNMPGVLSSPLQQMPAFERQEKDRLPQMPAFSSHEEKLLPESLQITSPCDLQATSSSDSEDRWECDWENLTDDEYRGFLLSLENTTCGVSRERFSCDDEYDAFLERHQRYLIKVAKQLSAAFRGEAVEAANESQWSTYAEAVEAANESQRTTYAPDFVKEKRDPVEKRRRSMLTVE